MSRFVLIPGAGGAAWYWHPVVPELQARGHEAVAVELPGADESAGLPEYTDAVVAAIGDHQDVVLVAQSMGGFTAPMACARTPVRLLVLLNAMIPLPGETAGQWWENTGWEAARIAVAAAGGYSEEVDLDVYFLHDVPAEIVAAGAEHEGPEAEVAFTQPCAIERWPDVPTRVIAATGDRFFPLEFQRRVARDRLGVEVDEVPGGHLAALSRPVELADRLVKYLG
ncbi:alpha/beta fold hydrolase [Streptomyces sp. R21]|uniref:Alpha/beta fold hydrolase n=1 Tax=Streptomyces sp. R21 TaxID=3238627 RepID=A0AB39P404_9ACTN